jgi:hypothetical protein
MPAQMQRRQYITLTADASVETILEMFRTWLVIGGGQLCTGAGSEGNRCDE